MEVHLEHHLHHHLLHRLVFYLFLLFLQIFYTRNHIFRENGSEMGQMLFDDMASVYCLKPTFLEHHAYMVDLLGFNYGWIF